MSLTDKIKNLISDGQTQQAVDMLQAFLKEKGGDDHQLLNQTLLLESQYKAVQKKAQLNIEDTSADLHRINYSLLNLCDEAESLVTEEEKKAEIAADTEGSKNPPPNPLVVFGVILGFATLVLGAIIYFYPKDTPTPTRQAVEVAPLPVPKATMSKNWSALTSVLNVNDRLYGNYKITISDIKTEAFDGTHDRLTLHLNFNCLEASSGKCQGNYVKFRLTTPSNEVIEPESDRAFDTQSPMTTREETVRFIVSKSVNSGMLDAFYVDKPKSKVTVKLLGY